VVMGATAGALIMVSGKGIPFKAFNAVDVEQVSAGEKIDWLVPKIHEADGALIVFALYSLYLHSLPIYFALLGIGLPAHAEPLQILFYLILVLQFGALDLHHFIQYLLL